MQLLIATTNRGKVQELRHMLAGGNWEVVDLSGFAPVTPVEETGRTFCDNACLKAGYYARHSGAWTLADDSGLSVDALRGSPGVHSARWAAMHDAGAGDEANNAVLLKQLEDVPDENRSARFVCSLAVADPRGRIIFTATDSVEGTILRQPRGVNGFGYDPLFFVPAHAQTTAEMAAAQKHAISHRGKAMRRMVQLMRKI